MTGYEKQIAKLKLDLELKEKTTTANQASDEAVCKAKVTEQVAKLAACNADLQRQQVIYTKALEGKTCPHPAWTYLSFVGGAVIGGAICAVAPRLNQ